MEIRVNRLGLAAFIALTEELLNFESRVFTFRSDKTLEEWEILYSNSCCASHDQKLCSLRRLYTKR